MWLVLRELTFQYKLVDYSVQKLVNNLIQTTICMFLYYKILSIIIFIIIFKAHAHLRFTFSYCLLIL